MSGRELLWDTLSGKPACRVPVAPFLFSNVVNEANGGEPRDPVAAAITLYQKFGFDILLRTYILSDYLDETCVSAPNWLAQKCTVQRGAGGWDEQTVVTTPQRQLTQIKSFRRVSPYEVVEAVTEYYIKDPADFEQFKKYQPPLACYDCSVVTHARALLGDGGLTGPWIQGAFNTLGMYRDLSLLLVDPYDDEDFYTEMMEYFSERAAGYMKQAIRAGADFISMSGNMASGSMAGPRMFVEFVRPYEMRMIAGVHEAGAKVIYHNCGDASKLLPLYSGMGIDMYESLTPPPYGDTVLEEALKVIAKPTALSGGIDQIDFLKKATPDQIRGRVREMLEAVKPRGAFVLAASDYILENTPEENLFALAEAGRAYGAY